MFEDSEMGITCGLGQILPDEVDRLRREPKWYPERRAADVQYYDMGKVWHCFHYLLTGSADSATPPLDLFDFAIRKLRTGSEGRTILDGIQVRELHRALEPITKAVFKRRFDPRRMAELKIYMADLVLEQPEEMCEQLLEMLDELKSFVEQAAANGQGLLVEAG
jgi:hypothetical protein